MRRFIFLPLILATASSLVAQDREAGGPGALIVAGGGKLPDEVYEKFLDRAGKRESIRLLVIPQASERENPGERSRELFARFKVGEIDVLDLGSREQAVESIRRASAIWISGGLQGILMKRLSAVDGIIEAIREKHQGGAPIAGSSAGAAVMSDVMIAGSDIPLSRGLALWPSAIVDQHFVARNRMQRLFRAVTKNPGLVGVGIGEETAVIVDSNGFEVVGNRTVTVVDARGADFETGDSDGEPGNVRGVEIHSLRSGTRWKLANK
jgi:cyanophycinase